MGEDKTQIPVFVLTGFLGSGKTTLLARALAQPDFSGTAVIINEMGEIGLDHTLVRSSSEDLIELTTGCLCCAVRGDLQETLLDLLARRDAGSIAPFERVVIETSGIADPAPILQSLMVDAALAPRVALAGVITVVDAITGLATLAREPQAPRQVAVADRIVVSKTDLTGGVPPELDGRLAAINPAAERLIAVKGATAHAALFSSGRYHPLSRNGDVLAWLGIGSGAVIPVHDTDVGSILIMRERPMQAVVLALLAETLAEHCGADLLRLKGIVALADAPERPAVVHGVQHVLHPVELLDAWPTDDRRSRLVLIGRRLDRGWVEALIDMLEAEAHAARPAAGTIARA